MAQEAGVQRAFRRCCSACDPGLAPAPLEPLGGDVAPDDEHDGGGLRDEPLPGREEAEPEAGPVRELETLDRRHADPADLLHRLHRRPDHDHEHTGDEDACRDEDLLVRQLPLELDHEEEDADDPGEPQRHALKHGERARLERHRLQEQHRLEALAVDAREPEQHEPEHLSRGERQARPCQDAPLPLVEALEVLLPVHLVEEPVEDQRAARLSRRARRRPRASRRSGRAT